MANVEIRAAVEADLPGIAAINNYYVRNTVLTFTTDPRPLEQFVQNYREITRDGLPYIVATLADSFELVGYANAHCFRDISGAYKRTVELTIYCAPGQTGRGIGSKLMTALIDVLREPLKHPDLRNVSSGVEPRLVSQALAIMAVDETGRKNGLGLKEWYESFGFECNGHLRKVGYKFGRWIDTMYIQLSL